jgi:hypothetical protein
MRITHIAPLSVAKVAFVLYGLIGLIIGGCIAIASLLGASLGAANGNHSAVLGAIFGVALIMSSIYNMVAGMVGGVELTIEPAPTAR